MPLEGFELFDYLRKTIIFNYVITQTGKADRVMESLSSGRIRNVGKPPINTESSILLTAKSRLSSVTSSSFGGVFRQCSDHQSFLRERIEHLIMDKARWRLLRAAAGKQLQIVGPIGLKIP